MSASRTLASGHSSEMGLYEVPCDEFLPGLGIGMTNNNNIYLKSNIQCI